MEVKQLPYVNILWFVHSWFHVSAVVVKSIEAGGSNGSRWTLVKCNGSFHRTWLAVGALVGGSWWKRPQWKSPRISMKAIFTSFELPWMGGKFTSRSNFLPSKVCGIKSFPGTKCKQGNNLWVDLLPPGPLLAKDLSSQFPVFSRVIFLSSSRVFVCFLNMWVGSVRNIFPSVKIH